MPQLLTLVTRACDAALLQQDELLMMIQDFLLPLLDIGPEKALRLGGHRLLSLWLDTATHYGASIDEYSGAALFEAVQRSGSAFLDRALAVGVRPEVWTSVANYAVKHKLVDMIQLLHAKIPRLQAPHALDIAASVGDLDLIQWLYGHKFGGTCADETTLGRAAREAHLDVIQWLLTLPELADNGRIVRRAMDRTALYGHLTLLQWFRTHLNAWWSPHAIGGAVLNGHFETADWMLSLTKTVQDPELPIDERPPSTALTNSTIEAFLKGNVRALDWLRQRGLLDISCKSMDRVKIMGHVHVLDYVETHFPEINEYSLSFGPHCAAGGSIPAAQWSHKRGLLEESMMTIFVAARHGHFEFIQWYESVVAVAQLRKEYDPQALEVSASKGYLECVQWLVENKYAQITLRDILAAMTGGHTATAQWLVDRSNMDINVQLQFQEDPDLAQNQVNRREFVTSLGDAMNEAAVNDHLSVVKWLHGLGFFFYRQTLPKAARRGHLGVVQYVVKHAHDLLVQQAIEGATDYGHLRVVKYLLSLFPRGKTECAQFAENARVAGHFHVARWIQMHGSS